MPDPSFRVVVDDNEVTVEDLSFREQRELRDHIRNLVGDPKADIEDVALMDFLPVLLFMFRRRTNPEFTLEEALDLKMGDIIQRAEDDAPPTKGRAGK